MSYSSLDWGPITPDKYIEEKNEAIFVYNVDLESDSNIKNVILFVSGRIIWNKEQLPTNCMQQVIFDVRGQILNDESFDSLVENIEHNVNEFLGKNYRKYSIDFKFS